MKKSAVLGHFGTQQAVADALGISAAAVSKWSDPIPKWRAYQIEKITRGKLKLDPDLYIKHQEALA